MAESDKSHGEAESSEDPLRTYRGKLEDTYHQAARDFDKFVLTLSGGALGISIAFIRDLVPKPQPCTVVWLGISWSLLAVSLMSTLASLLTSQHALRHSVHQVDAMIEGEAAEPVERPGGYLGGVTRWLNILSATALVLGIVFLVVFALANI